MNRIYQQLADSLFQHHTCQFNDFDTRFPTTNMWFRKPIRNAVYWFTGSVCRQVRKSHYQEESFTQYYDRRKIPTVLFHGTSIDFMDSIMSYGLLPKVEEAVFLTDNLFLAEIYAYMACTKYGGSPFVIRVDVSHMKHKLTLQFDFLSKISDDLVILPYQQYVCNSIQAKRLKEGYTPPSFSSTLFELICILQCMSNRTVEEEREIEYLRGLYYKRLNSRN